MFTNREYRTRGTIWGIESLVWALAAAVGPLLGGAFSESLGWRWCFYITRENHPTKSTLSLISYHSAYFWLDICFCVLLPTFGVAVNAYICRIKSP
jgi:MFS family permease